MRVVIAGQGWMGAEVLRLCLARGDDVAAVMPPSSSDRLANMARDAGIRVVLCERRLSIADLPCRLDLILAAHAHVYIDSSARMATRFGAIGYHPSLLPRHRGRDAVRWTIHMRDPIAGGTVYWLDDGADTGPIASQDWCHVLLTDNATTLWRRELGPMGVRLFAQVLADIDRGVMSATPQIESAATWEPSFRGGCGWRGGT
jgi:methionyl-tRNA formyltransferase